MTSEVADVWDAEAEHFDDEPDHGLTTASIRDAWADLLRTYIPENSSVLDLGCGTGSLSVLLAEYEHAVTGVDLSPRMLEQARRKAERHGLSAGFLLGDASAPPVTEVFDVVLARHVVWTLPDPSAALDRWLALLRPAGTLILVEGLWGTGAGTGTGAGLSAEELSAIVEPKVSRIAVRHLTDPGLWGRAITDERYLLTATR
jgi:SAM-dependent methyltransferase